MCMSAWPCVPIIVCGNSATHVSHVYKAVCVYIYIYIYIYTYIYNIDIYTHGPYVKSNKYN